MSEWLTVKEMSEKYGIDESNFHEWSKSGCITYFTMGDEKMLDDESFIRYLNEHKVNGLGDEALIQSVKEKELQREMTLSRLEDEVFLLQTHSRYPSLFPILIQELGACILDKCQREIFLAIASGEPVSRVAIRYGMTYDVTVIVYNSVVEKLARNTNRIMTLRQLATGEQRPVDVNNPMEILLTDILEYRVWIVLHKRKKMRTLYDLLEFTTRHGWMELQRITGIGKPRYEYIIKELSKKDYITVGKDGVIEVSTKLQVYMKKEISKQL